MPRLNVVETDQASGKTKQLYQASQDGFGMVFNLFKGLANAPLALEAYMTLDRLIASGKLSPAERDVVRLAASEYNGCQYCLAAHTMTGKMNGLSEQQTIAIRRGESTQPKYDALAAFTRAVLNTKGFVSDADIDAFRAAGYDDEHIAELVTILAQKTLSNLFNHIHDTELDLPAAPAI